MGSKPSCLLGTFSSLSLLYVFDARNVVLSHVCYSLTFKLCSHFSKVSEAEMEDIIKRK